MNAQTDILSKKGTPVEVSKSATAGADSRYIWHSRKPYHLRIYDRELQVLSNIPPRKLDSPPRRKEGDIKSFSKSSRIRMMRKLSRVHSEVLGEPIFLSCTMRAGSMSNAEFQYRFQKIFLPGIKDIIPDPACIWRLEPHKSGKPHYHLIIWSFRKEANLGSEFYKRPLRKLWRDTIQDHSKAAQLYSCRIKKITSRKELESYVSKYCAKVDDKIGAKIKGRRWATSKNLPVSPISEVNITHDQYKRLKAIVKILLVHRKMPDSLIEKILGEENQFWVWLSPDEIVVALEFLGLPPPINQYKRYKKTGNPLPDASEFAAIAEDYGHSF